jgi:multidrug efflux pump subunit AcrB
MHLSTLFFRNPRLTILAVLITVAAGLGALLNLGRQEDPTLIERYGYVLTYYPGADASRVEALVTDPIETALQELTEIDELIGTSRANVSQVRIGVREDLDEQKVDEAWTLIRQQVALAETQMPDGVQSPQVERLFVGATTMVVGLRWEGDGEPPLGIMNRLARDLEDRFQNYSGTEETDIFGEVSEEIRVIVDPDDLAAAGLSTRQAAALIARADAKAPAGQVRSEGATLGLEIEGEFSSIARIRSVPLLQRPDGSALRVGDIATVEKTQKTPPDVMASFNGAPTIMVGAYIEPNNRVDVWAAGARDIVDEFRTTVPRGIAVDLLFDQSEYTEARLNGLAKNLGFSAMIVFVVLFLFMGWRAAIVVGSALPLTVFLVLILFRIFNVPLHQMSVTGLVIALGLLIDNAIVVVDEFEQKRAKGASRLSAISQTLHHLFGPLFASTLTTALAFAPIAMLPGGAGEFVGMIGVSVMFAVVSSFFLAITVVLAFAGWFDRNREEHETHKWWRDGIVVPNLTEGYRWSLEQSLKMPFVPIAFSFILAFTGFYLATNVLPAQFFPQTERNQFQLEVQLPPEATIFDAQDVTREATEILKAYPGVQDVHWTIGEGAPRVYYNAFNNQTGVAGFAAGWVTVESADATRAIVPALQMELRETFPQARFLAVPYEQGPPVNAPIEFFVSGPDIATLDEIGGEMRRILSLTPGVTYTWATMETGAPKIQLQADETEAELAGVRLQDLAGDIAAELEGVEAGSVLEGVEEIPVRVIANNARRSDLVSLRDKRVGAGPETGFGAPLSALGDLALTPEIAVITHKDGERSNIIRASVEPYALPAPIFEAFQARLEAENFTLPAGYRIILGGEAAERSDALGNLFGTAVPLILAMAGCVALVFNSFRMSALVLTSGFLSVGLAFIGVWSFGLPFGFNAIIGAMGLLGISINGTIVVLSALRADHESVAGNRQAQIDTVVDATRHIVATTLTTMGGFVPLILTGDLFWLPLASGISVGVGGSALLALYFTPAVFTLTHRQHKKKTATTPKAEAVAT